MKLSLVITAKDKESESLKKLISSIDKQFFPRSEIEKIIVTEGTSESAKAIGIKKATGDVIGILASDNELTHNTALSCLYEGAMHFGACYSLWYWVQKDDNILNRYFALIGGNDPLSFYMGKNDHAPYYTSTVPSSNTVLGDNGFFVRRELILKTNLENYYHVENANEAVQGYRAYPWPFPFVWHRTGGKVLDYVSRRFQYAKQHAFNPTRRWHLVDFSKGGDVLRLLLFILASFTVIHPLALSIRGYLHHKDVAWFLHPVLCILTVFSYSILMVYLGLKKLSRLLSAPLIVQKA